MPTGIALKVYDWQMGRHFSCAHSGALLTLDPELTIRIFELCLFLFYHADKHPTATRVIMSVQTMNLPPDEIKVHDNASFREWCSSMQLNPKQVTAILRLSLPMVYKYINPTEKNKVRGVTSLACNLISEKSSHDRLKWLHKALSDQNCTDPWPANSPIISHMESST
jgi:hypothetical protein